MVAKVVYTGGSSCTIGGVCFKMGRAVNVSDAALIAKLKTTRYFNVSEITKAEPKLKAAPAPRVAVGPEDKPVVARRRKKRGFKGSKLAAKPEKAPKSESPDSDI